MVSSAARSQNFHDGVQSARSATGRPRPWRGSATTHPTASPTRRRYENDSAADGGESLARSVDGINATEPRTRTPPSIGHSYGSVVTGQRRRPSRAERRRRGAHRLARPGAGRRSRVGPLARRSKPGSGSAAGARRSSWPTRPCVPGPASDPRRPATTWLRELIHRFERHASDIHVPDPAAPEFGAQRFDTGPPPDPPSSSTRDADVPVYIRPGDIGIGSVDVPIRAPVPGGPQLA